MSHSKLIALTTYQEPTLSQQALRRGRHSTIGAVSLGLSAIVATGSSYIAALGGTPEFSVGGLITHMSEPTKDLTLIGGGMGLMMSLGLDKIRDVCDHYTWKRAENVRLSNMPTTEEVDPSNWDNQDITTFDPNIEDPDGNKKSTLTTTHKDNQSSLAYGEQTIIGVKDIATITDEKGEKISVIHSHGTYRIIVPSDNGEPEEYSVSGSKFNFQTDTGLRFRLNETEQLVVSNQSSTGTITVELK
jgi:hypothetical protein